MAALNAAGFSLSPEVVTTTTSSITTTASNSSAAGTVSATVTGGYYLENNSHGSINLDNSDQVALGVVNAAGVQQGTASTSILTITESHNNSSTPDTTLNLHWNGSTFVDQSGNTYNFSGGSLTVPSTESASSPVVNFSAMITDVHGITSYQTSATYINSGSNSLTELAGGDTFIFQLAANGSAGSPHVETISAFNSNVASNGGDVLNLADLLTGVSSSATASTLANYLHFTETSNGSGGYTTTVHVSSGGAFASGYSAAQDTLQVVLTNADLLHSAGVVQSDVQIIQSLLNQHKLVE